MAIALAFDTEKAGLSADPGEEEEEEEPQPAHGNELAYLAAATRNFDLNGMTLRVLGELAYLKHFDSGPDDALLLTGSVALDVEPLIYVATYTQQRNFVAEGPDTREHLADFEMIYRSGENTPLTGRNGTSLPPTPSRRMPKTRKRTLSACARHSISAETWSSAGRLR